MIFKYSAIDKEGKAEQDELEAGSHAEAVRLLHQKGLIPTELKEKSKGFGELAIRFSGVSLQDKILFIQNLGIMYKAGIPITRSVKILANQTRNPKFKAIMQQLHTDIETGKTLADSLSQHPHIFSNIFVSMIRVGEQTGNLDKSLEYLALQLQREHDLISKTRGAMIYPAVIVCAVVIVGILMTIFVLPSLIGIFKDSQLQLPITTRAVIALTDFMSQHTFLALGGMVAIVVAIYAALQTAQGKRALDIGILHMPVIGDIDKKINMARFARIMSSMLKSGTPILEGLQVTADSLGNTQYQDAIKQAIQDVKVGKTLSSSMARNDKLFSYIVVQMVGVGEESGKTVEILDELAEHFEADVDDVMKNMSSVIEPLLILFIGSAVGILAVALISPIYQLTGAAGG